MQYDIQYIVQPKWRGGFLCGKSNPFPTLAIRYRTSGSEKWLRIGKAEIDQYTYRRFKNTYYRDFKENTTDLMTLEAVSDYERLIMFKAILDSEFGGNIETFVSSIVYEDITMSIADRAESMDAARIALSLMTNGWRTMERTDIER